jgi:hypothetical protein
MGLGPEAQDANTAAANIVSEMFKMRMLVSEIEESVLHNLLPLQFGPLCN